LSWNILLEVSWPNFMSANGWTVVNSTLSHELQVQNYPYFLSYQQWNLCFQVKSRNETGVVRMECFTVQNRRDKFKFQEHVDHFSVVTRLCIINISPPGETVDLLWDISIYRKISWKMGIWDWWVHHDHHTILSVQQFMVKNKTAVVLLFFTLQTLLLTNSCFQRWNWSTYLMTS
jgi:hypothetical protein